MAKRTKIGAIQLEGKIFSGSGEAAEFIKLPWVKAQIIEKLGFTPYNGTLNIRLNKKGLALKRRFLNKAKPIRIVPAKSFCRGTCFRAVFMYKLECAIVIPEVDGYPEDIIEIIAPINLRENFQLKDGDVAKVKILFS
ncbi:MAG: CTP-dependent riboflavin kinase [Candidatus Bathyarchaeota archaeon]|nr:CTP-dependent riboflavin kinase [Candidatus Bathyarchaeota archaeon]